MVEKLKKRTIFEKIAALRKNKVLFHKVKAKTLPFFSGLKGFISPPKSNITIKCGPQKDPNIDDKAIVERIVSFYKEMKKKQCSTSEYFKPSTLWQALIDDGYSPLVQITKNENIHDLHFFLENFGNWNKYLGIESNTFIQHYSNSMIGRSYLKNLFHRNVEIWQWFQNHHKPLSTLSYPEHGNQVGAYIEEDFIGLGSSFNEIYGSMLSEMISPIDRPVSGEIGGGYGKMAYFITRNLKEFAYINFDLPEVLCLCAYYLIKSYPNKKIFLYGEGPLDNRLYTDYDIVLLPNFEIETLKENSIDLFINKNSFGEMNRKSVEQYLSNICPATKYLFHMNHEIFANEFSDGEKGFLASEFPIPKNQFRLLNRYPDLGHIFSGGSLDLSQDIFVYLYEKI